MKLNTKELFAIIFAAFIVANNVYAYSDITVNNNSDLPLSITPFNSGKITVDSHSSYSIRINGAPFIIDVPGYGAITIKDLGMNHIEGDGSKDLGILFSYQGSDMVARYNGGNGPINLGVGTYGEVSLSGNEMQFNYVAISRLNNTL